MSAKPLQVRLEAIDQRSGQYILSFDSSHYPITLRPEINVTFSEWLPRLRPLLIGRNGPAADIDPQDLLHNVGTGLWDALLPESAPPRERKALAHLLRTGQTPLLLDFPAVLATLPWELLCDPEQSDKDGFIALRRPLVRLSHCETVLLPIEPPLRVLLLISSPPVLGENSRVDVESERATVEQVTYNAREEGKLHLLVEDIVTPKRVQHVLMSFKPHIVHYVGHGGYNKTNGAVLIWEDEQGNELELSASHLAELLRPHNLHAVVIHACQTGRNNAQMDVPGIASTLVKGCIPIVLSQQTNFTYESSLRASKACYTALTAGKSMVSALFEVRQALTQAGHPDWAVPILQGSITSLEPLLDATALPGPPDPQLKSLEAAADLPTPISVFVGRHRELRELCLMLESPHGRGPVMALITGLGGVGKSTLAAQAIARYSGKYKANLTLNCQGYQSTELFLQCLGKSLKQQGAPGFLEQTLPDPKLCTEAKIEAAIAALNQVGPLLLVVDNLESVQNEDQSFQDDLLLYLLQKLLTNLRSGRVLITGRYTVKSLLPDDKFADNLRHLDLDALNSYEINQFLTRHPNLARLGKSTRQTLLSEFGGLPYVYDLLSSKAASASLDLLIHDVQGRITEERQKRSAQEWQQVSQEVIEFATLEETIKHLSEPSRTLLVKLSMLHLPFPLEAIEQGLGAARAVWLPLFNWSLLRYNQHKKTYHLHSLTRCHTEGLLPEQCRMQVQAQLAIWYKHYADHESHDLADYLETHRLFRVAGNVQQAGKLVMQLAGTLMRFGPYPLLRELCLTTLGDIDECDEQLTARTLHQLGNIAYVQGEYEEARRFYNLSLEIKVRLDDQHGRATTLHQLGNIAYVQGKYEEARQLYGLSLEIFEQLGDQRGQATTLHQLGTIAQDQREYAVAWRLYSLSLEISEQLGDQQERATTLHQLGIIAQDQREYEAARRLYSLSLEIKERLGDQRGRATTLHQLGMIAQRLGEYDVARQLYGLSLEIKEQLGDQRGRATTLHQLGNIAYAQGTYDVARQLYSLSLEISEQLGDQHGQATTLHQIGMIAQRLGEYDVARRRYGLSLEIFERLGDQRGQANSFGQLGMIAQDLGEYDVARRLYDQSLETFERLGNHRGRATIRHQLGMIAQRLGEYDVARQLYGLSLEIFEWLGDQRGRATTLHQLGNIAYVQGEYDVARRLYGQSLEIDEPLGDQGRRATILHQLGMIAQGQGEYDVAQRLYTESLSIKERLDDQGGQATTLHNLGVIAQDQGAYEEARRLYGLSLEIFEQRGDQRGQTTTLHQLGMIAQDQGEYDVAQRLYTESLSIKEQLGDQGGRATSLHQLGMIAQDQGEYDVARRLYGESISIKERLGDQRGCATSLHQLGNIAYVQGAYDVAQRLYAEGLSIFERLGDQRGRTSTLHQLGMIAQDKRKYEEARRLYTESLSIKDQLGDQSGRATTLHQLGNLAYVQEEYEEARGLYTESLSIKERLGDKGGRATTLHQLGIIAQWQGEYDVAQQLYAESLSIFEQLGDQRKRTTTLQQLGMIAQDQKENDFAYDVTRGLYEEYPSIKEPLDDQDGRANPIDQLGTTTQDQGALYEMCLPIKDQLDDQGRRANPIDQLGTTTQDQGEYNVARGTYGESLSIKEQLGDQGGRATALHQLGSLAYEQGEYDQALTYTVQAYILFDLLHSPNLDMALCMIARIANHIDETTFVARWQALAGGRPIPSLPEVDKDIPTDNCILTKPNLLRNGVVCTLRRWLRR